MTRCLGEGIWFPSIFINRNISWKEINENSVEATLKVKDCEISGAFIFDKDNHIAEFRCKRYFKNDNN